jgi:hypothetical protein
VEGAEVITEAITIGVFLLLWRAIGIWNERTAVEVESVSALTIRVDEMDDASATLHERSQDRIEELEAKVEKLELARGITRGD